MQTMDNVRARTSFPCSEIRDFRDKPRSTGTKFPRACDSVEVDEIRLSRLGRGARNARNEAAIPPAAPRDTDARFRCQLGIGIDRWDQAEYGNTPDRHNLPCFPGTDTRARTRADTCTDKRRAVPVGSSIRVRCQGWLATRLLRAWNSSRISGRVSR